MHPSDCSAPGRVPLLSALLLGLASCAHQAGPPHAPVDGLERAVFPTFVAVTGSGEDMPGFGQRARPFRACSSVYVAPGVLATSLSVLPPEEGGRRLLDTGAVTLLDGDYPLTVHRVLPVEEVPGLVLVQTRERGEPLALRGEPLQEGERLRRVAFDFERVTTRLPRATWSLAEALPLRSTLTETSFAVRTELRPGQCGALLLDARGKLAGLVIQGTSTEGTAVPASAIQRAVGRLHAP